MKSAVISSTFITGKLRTDGTKISLYLNDANKKDRNNGTAYYPKQTPLSVKHDGCVIMTWTGTAASGTGLQVCIHDITDKEYGPGPSLTLVLSQFVFHCQLLTQKGLSECKCTSGNCCCDLVMINDPKHTAKATPEFDSPRTRS